MKKSLLALAVAAALPAVAQAQSSVTLYGIADAGFSHSVATGRTSFSGAAGLNTQSRLGVRGREPITKDVTAVFQVETAISSGREAITYLGGRGAFVGLESKQLGTVTIGSSVLTPSFWARVNSDPSAANAYGLISYSGAARLDNSINYAGTFGGLTVRAAYASSNDTPGDVVAATPAVPPAGITNSDIIDIAAVWNLGALSVAGAYQSWASYGTKGTTLGATYDLKVAKVFFSYIDTDITSIAGPVGSTTAALTTPVAGKTMQLGVNVPAGKWIVTGDYRRADPDAAGVANVNTYLLAGQYMLSNRTRGTVFYRKPSDAKATAGVGLRHDF